MFYKFLTHKYFGTLCEYRIAVNFKGHLFLCSISITTKDRAPFPNIWDRRRILPTNCVINCYTLVFRIIYFFIGTYSDSFPYVCYFKSKVLQCSVQLSGSKLTQLHLNISSRLQMLSEINFTKLW